MAKNKLKLKLKLIKLQRPRAIASPLHLSTTQNFFVSPVLLFLSPSHFAEPQV